MSEEVTKNASEAGEKSPAPKAPKKIRFKKIKGVRPVVLIHPMGFEVYEEMLQNERTIRGFKNMDERNGTDFCSTFE